MDEENYSLKIAPLDSIIDTQINLLSNRFPACTITRCDPCDPIFQQQVISLDDAAYANLGIEHTVRGMNIFTQQYHNSEEHGQIEYVGIYTQDNKLAIYFSMFQPYQPRFQQSAAVIDTLNIAHLPILTMHKMSRDPDYSQFLTTNGAPHRVLLISIFNSLSSCYPDGFLLEILAQLDTQRLLSKEYLTRYNVTNCNCLLNAPYNDAFNPTLNIMLLHFRHLE